MTADISDLIFLHSKFSFLNNGNKRLLPNYGVELINQLKCQSIKRESTCNFLDPKLIFPDGVEAKMPRMLLSFGQFNWKN